LTFHPYAFNGLIVKVYMCNLYFVGLLDILRYHPETVVLAGNLTSVGNNVFNRMVNPPVTIEHLFGPDIIGQRQQLVPQTDTEKRLISFKDLLHRLYGIIHRSRVTGPI